jgi:hypothetical protein
MHSGTTYKCSGHPSLPHNTEEAPRQSLPGNMRCRVPKLSTMQSLSMHEKNEVVGFT